MQNGRWEMSDQHVLSDSGDDPVSPGPAEFSPPVPEDLLGRRIAAALIDLFVLTGLFIILSAATGDFTTSGASFHAGLGGAWIGVFLLLALLYYLVLEAWAGQTVGKVLLDVRVQQAGGTRPSLGAVALRTLLRIVDWLPTLYLAGFITMMVTGIRRQRIGDLAARTVMARAGRPAGIRGLALLPLAGVVVAAIIVPVSLSGSGGAQTYTGHDVSFAFPDGWSVGKVTRMTGTGNLLWTAIVGPGTPHGAVVGPGTPHGAVVVQGYRLRTPVTTQNFNAVVPEIARLIQQQGGVLHGSAQSITMAGLPGVQFNVTSGGQPGRSMLVFAFRGTTEYLVTCLYPPTGAAEIHRGCYQVLNTFVATG
jgi:uncharacterized RDD family membrane protein YckC